MKTRKSYTQMLRRGFAIGDKVRVKKNSSIQVCGFSNGKPFYGSNIGTIRSFLNDKSARNNGAALVEIEQFRKRVINVYIDTSELETA